MSPAAQQLPGGPGRPVLPIHGGGQSRAHRGEIAGPVASPASVADGLQGGREPLLLRTGPAGARRDGQGDMYPRRRRLRPTVGRVTAQINAASSAVILDGGESQLVFSSYVGCSSDSANHLLVGRWAPDELGLESEGPIGSCRARRVPPLGYGTEFVRQLPYTVVAGGQDVTAGRGVDGGRRRAESS